MFSNTVNFQINDLGSNEFKTNSLILDEVFVGEEQLGSCWELLTTKRLKAQRVPMADPLIALDEARGPSETTR